MGLWGLGLRGSGVEGLVWEFRIVQALQLFNAMPETDVEPNTISSSVSFKFRVYGLELGCSNSTFSVLLRPTVSQKAWLKVAHIGNPYSIP